MAEIFGHILGASTDHAPLILPLLVYGVVADHVARVHRALSQILDTAGVPDF